MVALFLVWVLGSCAPQSAQRGDILIIGDSVLAWNRAEGRDVGSALASELGRDVVNRAAFGAQIGAADLARIVGLSIPGQMPPGRWNWVIVNGAANDLGFTCGCTRCGAVIEQLISTDSQSGAIPDLISKAQEQGARVLWLGYYKAPETTAFRGCRPGLVEIERRIELLARSNTGLYFLDAEDVFDPPARDLFDADRTHPSAKGSALIGKEIARMIERAG
ncbi:SGNH/GDSL hydrolase family protein [Tropicibacter sp. R16_0]|nr:SGNH/GDSL hydrolase family protein [Tropicibacter sp. R16_0]